uniref:Retrotransposon protein, putative, unclassified n=1 Tax=Oryza sativa subsp. japonica TaxID=39947 RepID=Q2R8W2_ORYSJ|nr:retrotransposon protein, putative, unclassified [Oryza sativa Japonica Group]
MVRSNRCGVATHTRWARRLMVAGVARAAARRGNEKGGAARELEGRPVATGQQGGGQEGPEEGGGERVRREGGNRRQSAAVCRGGESGGTTWEQERRPAARAAVRGESRGLQEGGDERIRRGDGRRRRAVMRGGSESGRATVWGGSRELKAGGGAGSRREGGQRWRSAERGVGGNRARRGGHSIESGMAGETERGREEFREGDSELVRRTVRGRGRGAHQSVRNGVGGDLRMGMGGRPLALGGEADGGARSCAAAANRAERLFGVVQGSSRRVVARGVAEREANGGAQPSAAAAGTEHGGAVIAPRGARPGKQRGGARSSGRATASWFGVL